LLISQKINKNGFDFCLKNFTKLTKVSSVKMSSCISTPQTSCVFVDQLRWSKDCYVNRPGAVQASCNRQVRVCISQNTTQQLQQVNIDATARKCLGLINGNQLVLCY